MPMAIDPEVIPSSSNEGKDAVSYIPGSSIYILIGISILIIVAILKTLIPVLLMGLGVSFIWKQATKTIIND